MKTLCCLLGILVWGALSPLNADDCAPISEKVTSQVAKYLAQRFTPVPKADLSVQSVGLVANTCYQKLLIQAPGASSPFTMYLSPDQRFLVSNLYDLTESPTTEVAKIANNVQSVLMRDDSPSLAGQHSQAILVEFGDFQCPYCRRFAEWYKALPADLRDRTSLIFKQLPLDVHAWARQAAVFSACTGEQSPAAFWELSDYLLAHQEDIRADNVNNRATEVLSKRHDVNMAQLMACTSGGDVGAKLVARDEEVARQLAIHSTPTLFINGRRVLPLQSQHDLEQLLVQELQTSAVSKSSGAQ
jgi:protein-disulfide isomerase